MSQHHQPGHHPDADQLNAFVEHALPPHEREQTLTHLAACPACRAIVALSLPLDEAPAHPHAAPARKPWFAGWNLVWPVAAAFAALVPLVYFVHRTAGAPTGPAAPIQMAQSQPPAVAPPPASVAPAPAQPAAAAPSPRPATQHHLPAEPSTPPPAAAAVPATPASSAAAAAKAPASLDTQDASVGGTIENELYSQLPLARNGGPRNPAASARMKQQAQSKPGSGSGQGSGNGSSGVYGGTGQTNLNENYVEAMPAANMATSADAAAAATGAAATTIAVTSASPQLETTDSAVAELLSQDRARTIRLPSGLPTLSTASSGRVTLALDSAHALFVSDDGGRRWRPVPAPWPGRALRVDLAGHAAAPAHMAAMGAGLARSPAAFSPLPVPPPAGSGDVTGIVTDPTGAFIPNASIVVADAARQDVASARTDSAGRYRIDSLAPGHYRLTAFAPGFQRLEQPVALEPGQHSQVNLALQIGADTTTVTVTDAPPFLDSAARSQAANKAAAPALKAAAIPPAPLFEVTTESGDRWTSPDGQTWTRRP